jgi:hypothetical protein
VAQSQLPFNVVSKVTREIEITRLEQTPPTPKPRLDGATVLAQTNRPDKGAPVMDYRNASQDVGPRDGNLSSSPPLIPPAQLLSDVVPRAGPRNSIKQSLPQTDSDRASTLTDINLKSGSITGGSRIWLRGIDFPSNVGYLTVLSGSGRQICGFHDICSPVPFLGDTKSCPQGLRVCI